MVKRPIRVLEVVKSGGGVGQYARWIAAGAQAEDFRLTFVCLSEGGEELAAALNALDGVQAFSMPMARYRIDPAGDLRVLLRLRGLMRSQPFDLIHAHASKPGFLARLAARGLGIPLIYSPHCFAFHAGANPLVARLWVLLERVAARYWTTCIMTVADAERELGLANGVGNAAQYCTVHSGVVVADFSPDVARAVVRRSLDVPPDAPLVGVVGRLSRQKNPLGMVEIARQVAAQNPEVHFVWVGDGPLLEDAKARVRAAGLEAVFHFAGRRGDIPQVLAVLDVFALPSLWEAFPLTVLEAMAAGLPVVATAVQGVPEAVQQGETGLLVPPGDVDAFARALLSLLEASELRARLGEAARRRVSARFTRRQMLRRLFSLYTNVVEGRAFQ